MKNNTVNLDGSSKREQNRINRANQSGQNLDSNDMMSLKAMFVFLNEIANLNSQTFKEYKNDKAMQELIERTNKEFAISPEAASKFMKSEEFQKLNKHLIRPFDDKEIEAMSQEVLKKVGNNELEKILGVKGYFMDKVKNLAVNTLKNKINKDKEATKEETKEETNTNIKVNDVVDIVEAVKKGDINKIHRQLNRNR